MRIKTAVASVAAVLSVLGCAVVVIGLSDSFKPRAAAVTTSISPVGSTTAPQSPEWSVWSADPSATSSSSVDPSASSAAATGGPTSAPPSAAATVAAAAAAPPPASHSAAPNVPAAPRTTVAAPAPAPVTGQALPLNYSTGSATQIITVVAGSTGSTTATLQAWDKAPGGGWLKHGSAVTAHVGSAGLTTHPSESLSATPIGSFALSRAFGALANPGSGLTYHQTTSADWWISQPGSLYNTIQSCPPTCGFNTSLSQSNPNEHLYDETPYYNYAVVIEYNTGPVVQGAGSAFFLHVTDGAPTAGCVAIPQANLVPIMQWLNPTAQPRMLIGIG